MARTAEEEAYIFSPTGAGGLPTYEALEQRRRVAAAIMARRNERPKNLGEGLAALGEAWGDRGLLQEARAGELAAREYATKTMTGLPTLGSTPEPPPYDPNAVPSAPAAQTPAAAPGTPAAALPPGFQPPPAYLAAALDARIKDPARRAYLGHLAGKEAQNPNAVSPTGAAGPFQFTRGTGAQYGLIGPQGDHRTNVDASIAAADRLTTDNAKVLASELGREPTPQELALAHQQGAVTAVKMLTGTGNAPARNLAVNNAGGLDGQAAAQKIMAYYGMPGGSAGGAVPTDISASAATPPNARDSAATALQAQAQPPAALPPPAPVQVAQATGIQKAPAGPLAPTPVRPPLPTPNYLPTVTPQMQQLLKAASDPFLPPELQRRAAATLQAEQERIKTINDRLRREYEPHQKIRLEADAAAQDPMKQAQLEELRQRIAAGNRPKLEEKVEEKLIFDPATGTYKRPVIEGADPNQRPSFTGTEFQGKALVNYGRARLAHESLSPENEEVLASSPGQSLLDSAYLGAWTGDKFKEANRQRDNFVQAFIRQQSGGAYTPSELEAEARAMLPKFGDTPTILQQKRDQRSQFIGGLSSIIGQQGMRAAEYDFAKLRAEEEARRTKPPPGAAPLEFANEAEAAAHRVNGKPLPKGTKVIINGRRGEVQ